MKLLNIVKELRRCMYNILEQREWLLVLNLTNNVLYKKIKVAHTGVFNIECSNNYK